MRTLVMLAALASACGGSSANDAGLCPYPQTRPSGLKVDPRCPDQYGGGGTGDLCVGQVACPAAGVSCAYYGVGDGEPGCYAIAVMVCSDVDAGTPQWRCAQ